MLQRLPLSVDKLLSAHEPHPSPLPSRPRAPLEKQDALEMCLRSSSLIFELLIAHFKAIRPFEPFQSLWLRTITHLALCVNISGSGSIYQTEFVEMIGSLLRLLSSPHDPRAASSDSQNATAHGASPPVSELTLLQISWHAARAGCPTLLNLLKRSHPLIAELLQSSLENRSRASQQQQTQQGLDSAGALLPVPPITESSYRSLYSRLFESKPQIV